MMLLVHIAKVVAFNYRVVAICRKKPLALLTFLTHPQFTTIAIC